MRDWKGCISCHVEEGSLSGACLTREQFFCMVPFLSPAKDERVLKSKLSRDKAGHCDAWCGLYLTVVAGPRQNCPCVPISALPRGYALIKEPPGGARWTEERRRRREGEEGGGGKEEEGRRIELKWVFLRCLHDGAPLVQPMKQHL